VELVAWAGESKVINTKKIMNYFKLILLIIFLFCFTNCNNNGSYENEFYVLLNELFEEYDSTVTVVDVPMRYKIYDHLMFLNSPPPPNLYDETTMMDNELNQYTAENCLTSEDISYMMEQAKSETEYKFDSTKIKMRTISKEIIDSLYEVNKKASIDEYLLEKFNSPEIIFISRPLFNRDNNKVYFQIDYYCGNLCGFGTIYICEKNKNGWKVIKQLNSWIS